MKYVLEAAWSSMVDNMMSKIIHIMQNPHEERPILNVSDLHLHLQLGIFTTEILATVVDDKSQKGLYVVTKDKN